MIKFASLPPLVLPAGRVEFHFLLFDVGLMKKGYFSLLMGHIFSKPAFSKNAPPGRQHQGHQEATPREEEVGR